MDPFVSQDLFFAYALLQAFVVLLAIRFLDLYEREPLSLVLAMFFWGAIGAAILASLGNEFVESVLAPRTETVFGPLLSAPVVEEMAKGLALVVVFLASRWASRRFGVFELDGPTDGIVYGAAIGVGFAFTEDLYYFFRVAQHADLGSALQVFIDRRDFFGPGMLRHAIWTATFGAALGLATWQRRPSLKFAIPLLGLLLAMFMHALNNGLVNVGLAVEYGFDRTYDFLTIGVPISLADRMQATTDGLETTIDVLSWVYVAAFVAAIALWLRQQRRIISRELHEEIGRGVTAEEAALAPTFIARNRYYLELYKSGRGADLHSTTRMYGEIVDLAFARAREEATEQLAQRRRRIDALRTSTG